MTEKCIYCGYVYKSENDRRLHSCKFSEREKESRNADGILIWDLYKYWRSLHAHRAPNYNSFIQSRYYTIFKNLLSFVKKKGIPDPHHYVKFCSDLNILPNNWCMNDVYIDYLIHFDNTVSPEKQFKISVNTIAKLADIIDCKPNEVLLYLNFDEILKLIHCKCLSPWYLLFSNAFDYIYNKKLTMSEKIICDSVIDRNKWLEKMRTDKKTTKIILSLAKSHNIFY
jgi:hypothetical protein